MNEPLPSNPLVQRLRLIATCVASEYCGPYASVIEEAADEIDLLTGELDEARRVHQEWFNGPDGVRWYMAEIERQQAELASLRQEALRLTRERDEARNELHTALLGGHLNEAAAEIERLRAREADTDKAQAIRAAEIRRLRAALEWALNYIADGVERPSHDCEYISNPESGECTFCREYWTAREALKEKP